MRAVFAAHILLDKTADLVLGYPLHLMCPHNISAILNQTQPKHLSAARHLRLQCSLLLPDNIKISRCDILNPATLLPLPRRGEPPSELWAELDLCIEEPHDCFEVMKQESSLFPTVSEDPLENPDLTLFVDGSRYADDVGKFHTGFAVTSETEVLRAQQLPPHYSAQEAELKALTEACKMSEGRRANVYTDSRYAYGVAVDFGPLWTAREFITSSGTLVKNHDSIRELMDSVLLPEKVAILKVKAHTRSDTKEARGNALADMAAKDAAVGVGRRVKLMVSQTEDLPSNPPKVEWHLFQKLQEQASEEEREGWIKKGATQESGKLYSRGNKPCLPRSLFPMVAQWAHGPSHQSKMMMNNLVAKYWFAPGFSTMAAKHCNSCLICGQCNPGRTEKPPTKCLVRPLYPFQRIQIDHIQMPPSGGFEYALVVVDMFSGWPEAFPMKNQTAKSTAKKLLTEIVCRYGVPETIESDQGPGFTANLTKQIWAALGTELAYHTPYHPQSSGKVERLNGTLKSKMLKAARDVGKPWPESLPIALFSVRYTPRGEHKLSPYEILFGSAPRLGLYFPQQLNMQYDTLTAYVVALSNKLADVHSRVFSSLPDPEQIPGTHTLCPGDWVYVKKFTRKNPLEPRFDGPYQVLLTTATSVKLEGKPTWIHASHCKKAQEPEEGVKPS